MKKSDMFILNYLIYIKPSQKKYPAHFSYITNTFYLRFEVDGLIIVV